MFRTKTSGFSIEGKTVSLTPSPLQLSKNMKRTDMTRPLLKALILTGMIVACLACSVPLPAQPATPDAPAGAPAPEKGSPAPAMPDTPPSEGRVATLMDDLAIKWKLGGPTMYALAFVALVAVVFGVDRIVGLRRARIVPHGLADRAHELWRKSDYADLVGLAEESRSSLGRVIKFVVEHRSNGYAEITSGAEDIAARDFELHTRRNYPLVAVGTIAPLLGLMGTIFGLMGAFASIGVYGSMDDPSVLAKDIGEAMITTATGLIIAVPALGLYHYFRTRTGEMASILGEEASNLMHAWFLKKEGK